MPHRQPFPDWKWPLTHNERVAELEEILRDDHHEPSWENIRAAIEFHRKFDGEALCDAHPQVRFQNGQQLKDGEWPTLQSGQWQLKYWVEVIPRAPILFLMLKIYQGAIRQRTLNPAPHTQAMASPLVPILFNVQTLAQEDGIIGPASWTSFPYNASIRMQEVNAVIDATSLLILNFRIFLD